MKLWHVRRRAERAPGRWIAAAIAATTFTAPALTLVIAANPAEAAGGGSVVPGQPTLSNPVAGGGSDYTIPFTTSASGTVASGGTITIVAPTGTHFPMCTTGCTNYTLTVGTNTPVQATSISSPSPNQVTITVPSTIGANAAVTVVVNSVSNPTTASNTYTLRESTTGDTTPATSPAFVVSAGAPAFVVASGGDNQSAQISTHFPQPLVATVTDSFGNPETPAGDTILFQAPASGASASFTGGGNSDSVQSANGNYPSSVLTANGTTGSYTVSATLMSGANPVSGVTNTTFKLTNLSGPPPGSVTPGSVTPGSHTVGASTSYAVTFTPSAGGSLPSNATITFVAPNGTAFPPGSCTLGSCSGYSISAATGTASISAVAVSPANGSTTNNKVIVTVNLGLLSPNLSGQVTVTINSVGNPTLASVSYTIGELTSVDPTQVQTSTYAVTHSSPVQVVAVAGTPQGAMISTQFASPLTAAVVDAFNNRIALEPITFTIGSVNGASSVFNNGTTTEPDQAGANGLATTTVLTANGTQGSYSVNAAVPNDASITSANFFLTNTGGQVVPGAVSASDHSAGAAGVTYTIPFTITSGGSLHSGDTITLSAPATTVLPGAANNYTASATPPGHGNGNVAISAVNVNNNQVTITLGSVGTPVAPDSLVTITINNVTNPTRASTTDSITEQTKVDNTPATSPEFTINPAQPSQILVDGGDGQSASPNTAFANPLSALVEDQFGNPVSGVMVTFTLPANQPTATFAGGSASEQQQTIASGVATSSTLTAGSGAGSYVAHASIASVANPVMFNLHNATVLTPQTITLSSAAAGNNPTTYTIPFITSSTGALPTSGGSCPVTCQVTLVAPNGTVLSGTPTDYTLTVSGNHAASVGSVAVSDATGAGSNSVSSTANRAVISLSSSSIAAGDLVTVTIHNVTNPTVAFAGNSILESTTADNGAVTSPHYAITAAAPATLSVVSGASPQSQTVAQQYATDLEVNVLDTFGNPVSGTAVTFSAPGSGASVTFAVCSGGNPANGCIVSTDSQGNATAAHATATHTAGTFQVTASVGNLQAQFNLDNLSDSAHAVTPISGNNQSVVVNSQFASPLVAQVTDQYGNPIVGTSVVFSAPSSGPSVTFATCRPSDPQNQCTVVTDSSGNATSTTATANSVAGGPYTVTASDPGLIGNFSLTNLTGAASRVVVLGGSNQQALVFSQFGSPLQARITDSSGNPIAGLAVTFTTPASGATATFASCAGGNPSPNQCVEQTDALGDATSSALAAGANPGTFGVQVSANGSSVQAFSLTDLQSGYWIVGSDGGIFTFGGAPFYGSTGAQHLNAPIVGMAKAHGGGYYLVASDGGIFSFGPGATYYGSTGAQHLNAPIVGMALDPRTGGYWLVARDGGVFSFNAPFWGSMGAQRLNAPIVGIAATPEGGYYLVASDGGIFSFGPGATFYGSTGDQHLNAPIVGMATAPDGGYWLVASDGGIFTFGPGAVFFGSAGDQRLNNPIVGMSVDPATGGYWLVASDGGIFSFGAPFYGSTGAIRLNAPMVGVSPSA